MDNWIQVNYYNESGARNFLKIHTPWKPFFGYNDNAKIHVQIIPGKKEDFCFCYSFMYCIYRPVIRDDATIRTISMLILKVTREKGKQAFLQYMHGMLIIMFMRIFHNLFIDSRHNIIHYVSPLIYTLTFPCTSNLKSPIILTCMSFWDNRQLEIMQWCLSPGWFGDCSAALSPPEGDECLSVLVTTLQHQPPIPM